MTPTMDQLKPPRPDAPPTSPTPVVRAPVRRPGRRWVLIIVGTIVGLLGALMLFGFILTETETPDVHAERACARFRDVLGGRGQSEMSTIRLDRPEDLLQDWLYVGNAAIESENYGFGDGAVRWRESLLPVEGSGVFGPDFADPTAVVDAVANFDGLCDNLDL